MQLNAIHNIDFLNNNLSDKSCHLIIADPPYYRVKGEFDKAWSTFELYLQDVEKWAIECNRLLANNGTLVWWGHALNIAYSQIILDKYFSLLNVCIWQKTDAQANKCKPSQARRFVPVTERFLIYENNTTSNSYDVDNSEQFKDIKEYLRNERDKFIQVNKMRNVAEFNKWVDDYLNCCTVSRHSFADSQFELIAEKHYNELQKAGMFQRGYSDLSNEYYLLKQEYDDQKRYFKFPSNNNIYDVIDMPMNTSIMAKYKHPTQKPEQLASLLISTCSRQDDLVCIPFAGSGTECAMAAKYGRNFIGFDVNTDYCEMAHKRV